MSLVAVGAGIGALAVGGTAATAGTLLAGAAVGGLAGAGLGSIVSGGGGGGGSAAPQIDPAQVGQDSLATQIQLAGPQYDAIAKYAPQYATLYNNTLNQQVLGTPTFNAAAALAAMPADQQASIAAEAQKSGRTAEQWLTAHVAEEAPKGDAYSQSLQSQFGGSDGGLINLYKQATPQLSQIQATANTAQRQADINDVTNLGAQATAAYQAANPNLTRATSSLDASVNAAANRAAPQINPGAAVAPTLGPAAQAGVTNAAATLAPVQRANGGPLLGQLTGDASRSLGTVSPIQAQLNQQAQALLDQGGTLSAQDLQSVQQSTRAAAAARGLYDSNSAMGAEILNTDAAQRARLLQNQQQAQAIDASSQQQIAANRTYAQGVQAQGQNLSQFNTGQANSLAQSNAGLSTSTSLANAGAANTAALANAAAQNQFGLAQYATQADLSKYNTGLDYQTQLANAGLQLQNQQQGIQNQFGLANTYAAQAQDPYQLVLGRSGAVSQAQGTVGQAQSQNIGTPTFDPFNSGIMNIYAGNAANQTATNVAAGNNQANTNSALIGAAGKIAGAYFCWVAREVYGTADGRWWHFRRWMAGHAPEGLLAWYLVHGRQAAQLVRRDPALKAQVRAFMDAKISELAAHSSQLSTGLALAA